MLCRHVSLNNKGKMAGVPGFEPGMPIPKTGALPLGYTPTIKKALIRYLGLVCRGKVVLPHGLEPRT